MKHIVDYELQTLIFLMTLLLRVSFVAYDPILWDLIIDC